MMYHLTNKYLNCSILHNGAELCKIQSKASGKNYMWNADSGVWGSYAPVLFPIVAGLKNGTYSYNNKTYSLGKHGFIRNNNALQLIEHTAVSLRLALEFSEETLQVYPFKFRFTIQFQLEGNCLIVSHTVENLDNKALYFSSGAHPGFKCPLNDAENYEDYYLEFEKEEYTDAHFINEEGLVKNKGEKCLSNTKTLALNPSMFDNDALIFKNLESRKVSLKSKASSQTVTVDFEGFNYLGVWAKPASPFICIEPWNGLPDVENTNGDLTEKEGIKVLQVGGAHKERFSIEINE